MQKGSHAGNIKSGNRHDWDLGYCQTGKSSDREGTEMGGLTVGTQDSDACLKEEGSVLTLALSGGYLYYPQGPEKVK